MYQRKSDGRWCENINGKVIYGKTKKELLQKIQTYNSKEEKGISFVDAADAWENYHTETVTYKAAEVYRPALRRAKEYFGDKYLKDISSADVNAFILYIASKQYARRTVQLHLDMMRMVFDYAAIQPQSTIKENPCRSVRMPKGLSKTRRLPPTDAEIAKVTPDSDMGLFATFLLYTGMRKGELLALQWKDIDIDNQVIHVYKTVYYESNQPKLKPPKTDAGYRDIDLLDILASVLEPSDPEQYVFGGDKPMTKSSFFKRWRSYTNSIGIEATPHQFRHAYASMLDDAGIDEVVAQNLLGHSSIQVTKDVYTHLRKAKRQRAVNQLNNYISGAQNHQDLGNTAKD